MPHKVTLREAPHKREILERHMRYDVLLNGELYGELYFNMTGYHADHGLPLPDGRALYIGERGISEYRREIARINREAKNAA